MSTQSHTEDRADEALELSLMGEAPATHKSPHSSSGARVTLPQGGYVMNPGVKSALYRVARFTLSQGAYPHFEQLALALTSRLYQALNLIPDILSQELIKEASRTTEAQRMLMSVELAGKLSAWLSQRFTESQLSDLLQGILWAMSASEGRLHSLLTALNLEVLAPLKVKLNPRKWIEAEERMGAALYQACLLSEPSEDSSALPRRSWPELADYELLVSEPAQQGVHRFFAVRNQDQLRCWLYLSEELSFGPKLTGAWPAQYMAPLERGEWQGMKWVSVPSVSSIHLGDLLPYLDTYCSLSASEQALEILAALHHQGVNHLDFRPELLVIDHRLQLRALPHLSAHAAERVWRGRSQLSPTPWSVYVSPEQRQGGEGDTRSDLWSYGALLFELFQGRPLIEVSSWRSLPEALIASGEQPLKAEGVWIPEGLRQLVERCVCDNPDERWADARLVLESFRPVAQEIRSELKSQGRSAQWSRLIAEGHLLSFVEAEVSARLRSLEGEHEPSPSLELISERFLAHLDDLEVPLSSAEEPSMLLRELVDTAYELKESLIEWETIQSEAELARATMIQRIDDNEPLETFEQLKVLLDEKELILEALSASQARIIEIQERKPRVFYERLQRFIDQEQLEVSLERLVGVHVELEGEVPKEAEGSGPDQAVAAAPDLEGEPASEPSRSAAERGEARPGDEPRFEELEQGSFEQDWYDAIDPELSHEEEEASGLESLARVAPASAWLPQEPIPDFDDLSKIDQPDQPQALIEASEIEFDDLTGLDQLGMSPQGPRDPFASAERWAPAPQLSSTSEGLYGESQAPEALKNTDERVASLEQNPLEEQEMFEDVEGPALHFTEVEEELKPTPSMLPIAAAPAPLEVERDQVKPELGPGPMPELEPVTAPVVEPITEPIFEPVTEPVLEPSAVAEPEVEGDPVHARHEEPPAESRVETTGGIELQHAFQSPEEIKQVRILYERFLTLKIEHNEPIDDISFEGFLEEINQAYLAYVSKHGAQAFKFSVHYRKGRVMLRARPVG